MITGALFILKHPCKKVTYKGKRGTIHCFQLWAVRTKRRGKKVTKCLSGHTQPKVKKTHGMRCACDKCNGGFV